MSTAEIVLIVVGVVIVVLLAAVLFMQYRSRQLRQRYGSEYSRAVRESGSTWKGETKLRNAEKRVASFHVRPLGEDERQRFTAAWVSVQQRFVDDPKGSLAEADRLVREVMTARGYPMANFEQSTSDIAVDHPVVVERYRAAHAIYTRQVDGDVSTEDLRQGMVHYRALFEDLLGSAAAPAMRRAS